MNLNTFFPVIACAGSLLYATCVFSDAPTSYKVSGQPCNPQEEEKNLRGDDLAKSSKEFFEDFEKACDDLAKICKSGQICQEFGAESTKSFIESFKKFFESRIVEESVKIEEEINFSDIFSVNISAKEKLNTALKKIDKKLGTEKEKGQIDTIPQESETFANLSIEQKRKQMPHLQDLKDLLSNFKNLLIALNKLQTLSAGSPENDCSQSCENCFLSKQCLMCTPNINDPNNLGTWTVCDKEAYQNALLAYIKNLTEYMGNITGCVELKQKCSLCQSQLKKENFDSKSFKDKVKIIKDCLYSYFEIRYILTPKDEAANITLDDYLRQLDDNFKVDDKDLKKIEMLMAALETFPNAVNLICYTQNECTAQKCNPDESKSPELAVISKKETALFEENIDNMTETERLEKLRVRVAKFISQTALCGGIKKSDCSALKKFACSPNIPGTPKATTQKDLAEALKKIQDQATITDFAGAINTMADCLDKVESLQGTHLCDSTQPDGSIRTLFSYPDNKNLSLATRLTNLEIRTTALEVFYDENHEYAAERTIEGKADSFPTKIITSDRIKSLANRISTVIDQMGDTLSAEEPDKESIADTADKK